MKIVKIKSIKKVSNYSPRYDLTIKDNHNFFANGILVHNCTMYKDHIHARSIDSRGGIDRDWVKNFWSKIAHDIPNGWRICGENLWAKHSILYENLTSYFYGFSIWDDKNICQSWDDTIEYFGILGIQPVEVIYDDIWDEAKIRSLCKDIDFNKEEGYVVRLADAFPYGEFKNSIAKFVRKNHLQTAIHWRNGHQFVPNKLIKND